MIAGVSPFGPVAVLIGIALFLYDYRGLLWATFFIASLQYIEVVKTGVTTVHAFQVFAGLYVVKTIILLLSKKQPFRLATADKLLLAFVALCSVSIVVPVVADGTTGVFGEGSRGWDTLLYNREPLRLSWRNFTQLLYLFVGVAVYFSVSFGGNNKWHYRYAINGILWGCLAVATSGILFGILYKINEPQMVRRIFNIMSVGEPSITGYSGRLVRTWTLAGEPGDSGLYYTLGMGLIVGSVVSPGKTLIKYPRTKASVILTALLISGSTAGFVGLAMLIGWSVILTLTLEGSTKKSILLISSTASFVGVLALCMYFVDFKGGSMYEWFLQYHISKIEGGTASGAIRWEVARYSIESIFAKNPILGVGYGSSLSLSLGLFILTNVGILGSVIFVGFLGKLMLGIISSAKCKSQHISQSAYCFSFAYVPFIVVLLLGIGAFAVSLSMLWLLLGTISSVCKDCFYYA